LRQRTLLLAALLAASAGCVDRIAESRVRSVLVNGGVPERTADCMAGRMVDRLSIGQLRKLERLRGPKRSLDDYLAAVARVGDAEVIGVTASSAALCVAGLGG
jgi:hypothetical protein